MSRSALLGIPLGLTAAFAATGVARFFVPKPVNARVVIRSASALPIVAKLPDFNLIERSGQPFRSQDMLGSCWIADFIFTSCAGTCPMMSAQMAKLHREIKDDNVRFVSFSVDPKNDTPEVLRGYAKNWNADERWFFVTGRKASLHALAQTGFKLAVFEVPSDDGPFTHSEKFALVDRRGRVRGYFNGTDSVDFPRLKVALGRLLREGM